MNKITLTPEMAKRLGLDLKVGDDVAIMLKGKVEETGDNMTLGVEDVRGKMIDGAMLTKDGDEDHSLMARAFRLAERKRNGSDDNARGKAEDEQPVDGGEDKREEEEDGA